MAWFEREFVAAPDDQKNQLVYKWPDVTIRRYTRAIVNADEVALFVNTGRVTATMGPGRHRIDVGELPGLGALIDTLSGGNAYRAELYFVRTREFPGIKFGGRLDDILDPRSEQVVTMRAFGEYALAVRNPADFITSLAGTVDLANPAMVQTWCTEQLLKVMKITVIRGVASGHWPLIGLAAHLPEVEDAVLTAANTALYEYGLRITRMGNIDINLAPEDAERIKRLAKDLRYIQLAGGFQPYAAGELALGASKGMSMGGGAATEGGFLGAGLGLGQQITSPPPPTQQPELAQATPGAACPSCATPSPAGAAFCMKCGTRLNVVTRCASCDAELPAGAKFCGSCGSPAR